jgi:hypothetical protein
MVRQTYFVHLLRKVYSTQRGCVGQLLRLHKREQIIHLWLAKNYLIEIYDKYQKPIYTN